jgi:hypothetical protein
MNIKVLGAATLLLVACKGEPKETESSNQDTASKAVSANETAPAKEAKKKAALPETTEVIALNTDGHAIPASIEMPTGSTIFMDEPTSLRIGLDGKDDLGRRESLFAVGVKKGNQYNLNLEKLAKDLAKNQYGSTHEILEQSEELLLYKSTVDDSGFVGHSFQLIVDLGGDKWLCTQGNDGGWSEEQARAQLAACKTLKPL